MRSPESHPPVLVGIPDILARACRAEWLLFRPSTGAWIEIRREARAEARHGESLGRKLAFDLLLGIPAGRLVRIPSATLERRSRHARSGIRELLVYTDRDDGVGPVVAIALRTPLVLDPAIVEALARALVTVDGMDRALAESTGSVGRRRADHDPECVAHDLRHALTLASMEIERCAVRVQGGATSDWSGALTALSEARSLCDRGLSGPVLQNEPIDLRQLLEGEIASLSEPRSRPHEIVIDLHCFEALQLTTDPTTLRRIVRNVLLNAIEASPNGARIDVETRRSPRGDVQISVRDEGRGMGRADLGELFEFGRSGRGGFGIGTTSARVCARLLGGELRVQSNLFAGTTVVLQLPEAPPAVGGVSPTRP